jgi:hypothetical protein
VSPKPLHVEADFVAPWLVRALAKVKGDARVRLSVGRVNGSDWRQPGVMRVERASLLAPAVTVLAHPASHSPATEEALGLSTSVAAWQVADRHREPWRLRSAPLPPLRWGQPDAHRGWALVAREALPHRERIQQLARARDLQLHFLAARPSWKGTQGVCWATGPRGLGSLLGRVEVVFAPPGALAWDAQRAGAHVIDPAPADPARAELTTRRLANVVPPALVGDTAFWQRLVDDILMQEPSEPWGTLAWFEAAQAAPPRRSVPERWKRKLLKLRRDPRAFVADSRYALWR